jgi:hypothetical protein
MLRTVLGVRRALQMVAVILAITAMLSVSAASASAAHAHVKGPFGRCDVCSTAHQAAQQIIVVQVVHAPNLHSRMAQPVAIQRVESRRVLTLLSRGPPSALLTTA